MRVRRHHVRRALVWLAVPSLLVGLAGFSVAMAADAESLAASPPPAGARAPAAGTPILSLRRVPEVLVAPVADRRLRAELDAYAQALPGGACLVVAVDGERIAERDPDVALIPASNQKLLTALAALDVLGSETRLTTQVLAAAPPAGGVVEGDLFLVGGGDPLLMTADYAATLRRQPQLRTPVEQLADDVVAAGVREVRGAVVGDESRFDQVRTVPSWPSSYLAERQVGPLTALSVNDGFSSFRPNPEPAADPAASAAAVLADLLRQRGVVIRDGARSGQAPAGAATVASIPSAPLREVVGEMLAESDNGTAELLLKEIGRVGAGSASTAAGVQVTAAALGARGLPLSGSVPVDGSGLDRGNLVTCSLLDGILRAAGPSSDLGQGLAVAGQRGTLGARFRGTAAEGRLLGKTGSIREVSSLSGFVTAAAGHTLTFALVVNGPEADRQGFALQDALVDILARYPDAPSVEQLGPLPAGAPGA
ncbi:MAG: D-alanyl-D-alanine carboxypeptidase/D-alanyl-D-alanine-endopeptidase [Acidimicrobiales bacterium]|nr:D-alanyl-D-alanine carboxypeptidase/D-alanyl-D-alanine-endopeptidase [Acidimicrobiales bacterium]